MSMTTARWSGVYPGCQETHLCKANPKPAHVSQLVQAFEWSGCQVSNEPILIFFLFSFSFLQLLNI